jgi:hypothetical protein
LGRAKQKGLLRKGPFIYDGPVVRSVLVYVLSAAGIGLGIKGQIIPALVFFILAILVSSAARFRFLGNRFEPSSVSIFNDDDQKAFELLGIKPTWRKSQIEKAYRQLMKKAHPDQGGAEDLAKNLNWARDHLLKRLNDLGFKA